jgi:CHASE1-domain containing sensor protein
VERRLRNTKGGFLKKNIPAVIIAGAGILLSVMTFVLMQRMEFRVLQHKFIIDAGNYSVALEKSIDADLNSLNAIEGLYASSPQVTRARFHTFAGSILFHSQGIHALRWAPYVAGSLRGKYEAAAVRDGLRNYHFTELNSERQTIPAGKRDGYFPIYFSEPAEGSEAILGLDLSARPARRAALEKARDEDAAVATSRISLLKESSDQFSFVVLQPIYRNGFPHDTVQERRKNLLGFAVGVFRFGDMVDAALGGINLDGIEISLHDDSAPAEKRLLYTNVTQNHSTAGIFHSTKKLRVADRTWTVTFYSTPEYLSSRKTPYAWAVLAAGLMSSVLLALYVYSMKRHALEEQQVQRMYAERRLVETQLRMLQAQIEPHFLFNTLGNVVSFIDRDPKAAKELLQHITTSLRLSLRRSREEFSTLAQEAEMLKSYLSIFKMRLGTRLDFTVDIPGELLELPFPPMLLQPLVENAVIHGIEPKVEGGRIEIKAEKRNGLLRISVSDTGLGFSDAVNAQGIGLENVKARLQGLYKDAAELILEDNTPCGTVATIEVLL